VLLLPERAEGDVARGRDLQRGAEAEAQVRLGGLALRGRQLVLWQRIVPVEAMVAQRAVARDAAAAGRLEPDGLCARGARE